MEVVVDSHALFWFLSDNPKLSLKARHLLSKADRVVVPSIVVMEILYILEKNNLAHRFVDFLGELKVRKYLVYPLDLDVIAQALAVPTSLEMHDRLILATAKLLCAKLISRDREIGLHYPETVW